MCVISTCMRMCFLCTFSCECSLYADYLHLPVWLCKRSKDGDQYLPSYSHPCSDQLQYWINWLKRGCEALIRIKELVNDPNITGRQSCKPEAEWSEKRVRLENTETRQARNRWWCWWSRGTQGKAQKRANESNSLILEVAWLPAAMIWKYLAKF